MLVRSENYLPHFITNFFENKSLKVLKKSSVQK